LLGYSGGGIIAFEMAQQLVSRGEQVAFLGLLDIIAPPSNHESTFLKRLDLHLNILQTTKLTQRLKYWKDKISRDRDRTCRDDILKSLADRGRLTPKLSTVLDYDLPAKKDYQPQVYPGAVTLFRSEYLKSDLYPDLGWRKLVAESIDVRDLPLDLPQQRTRQRESPNVPALAAQLQSCIDLALGNPDATASAALNYPIFSP
jgi:thioesterase domain-containing protein